MKDFMDKNFLLGTDTARHLYHDYAASMPLVDYHCQNGGTRPLSERTVPFIIAAFGAQRLMS